MGMRRVITTLWTTVLAGCSVFGVRSGYEQPPYDVIDHAAGGVEIRRYGPRLAAETTVEAADADSGQNAAFRILAAYIFGANRSKSEIAMTAPVEVQARSEKITMTAPVETAVAGDGRYVMRFFLPSSLSLATAPQPTDPRVRLVALAEETIAVRRFTGSGSAEQVATERQKLLHALEASPWRPAGIPVALFYDPPWTIPFLRRNEVAVTLLRVSQSAVGSGPQAGRSRSAERLPEEA